MARHKLCRIADIIDGEMKSFDVSDRRIMVVTINGRWYAADDMCSHAQASLAMGELDAEKLTVCCPLHGAVFELETGQGIEYPAVNAIDTFPVTIEGDELFVDLD